MGTAWINIQSFPVTVTVTIPKTKVTKYQLGAGWPFQAPRNWSVNFLDERDAHAGTDVREGETFALLETREYDVAPTASVTKAFISFEVTIDRNITALRINEDGQLEVVPPNTARYTYDPVTLEPLGLLVEPAATNLISGDMVVNWSKDKIAFEETDQVIGNGFPAYILTGNGVQGTHTLASAMPRTDAVQTLSIYAKI